MAQGFELTFWGSPRMAFRRVHNTYESARDEAGRVHDALVREGACVGRFRAIVHGPGLGRDGRTVW